MKVVLFCGGFGIRMGPTTERTPKPMIPVGGRPILWHIMRYYAAWGHKDFILCLGHRAEVIEEYFLSQQFEDWRITCLDTGDVATTGERLKAVGELLGGDTEFLATYGDGLTDAPLDEMIALFRERDRTALFMVVRPRHHAHVVELDELGGVRSIEDMQRAEILINGGFFVFKRRMLDLIGPGEEVVEAPFRRLIAAGELVAYPYEGFWAPMDTLKDRQYLESLAASGNPPWEVAAAGVVPPPALGDAPPVAQ